MLREKELVEEFLTSNPLTVCLLILIAGGLLSFMFHMQIKKRSVIEEEADSQTKELQEFQKQLLNTNRQLEKSILYSNEMVLKAEIANSAKK